MTAALAFLFFLTALVYSMAGFGGGSTYLALLVLFAVPFDELRTIALICNIAVVASGSWHFARSGFFPYRMVLPFIVASVPMAFLGGTLEVGKVAFTWLLMMSLAVAAIRMLWIGKPVEPKAVLSSRTIWSVGLPVGALLGFVSGVVGIGGGIYLAPVLLLLGWADSKQTAGACSFFILLNSLAGLGGQAVDGLSVDAWLLLPLLIAVVAGGQIGSRLGAGVISKLSLQKISGVLILAVSCRMLWTLL